jgi:GNAT superfamily N-acetyltransferase
VNPARLVAGVRRHGLVDSARIGWRALKHAAAAQADEGWHMLRLDDPDRVRRELPDGLRLRRGSREDLDYLGPALAEDVSIGMIERRFAHGAARLWIAESDEGPAFSCWIFTGYTPSAVAPGERLDLPPATVGLEDSFTAPDFRGRGVAPAAWTAIADVVAGEGARAIATPVAESNEASRRGVAKAGFEQVAVAHMRRRAFRTSVTVEGEGEFADWLRERVER